MKTILEVRITPFPSFSFLKDPVRHDESLVLVRRDEEVRNMFDLFIDKMPFSSFIVESWPLFKSDMPRVVMRE